MYDQSSTIQQFLDATAARQPTRGAQGHAITTSAPAAADCANALLMFPVARTPKLSGIR